jgi:hypothetical protein
MYCSFIALEGRRIIGTAVCKVATLAESTGTIQTKNFDIGDETGGEEDEFPAKFDQLDKFFTDLSTDYGRLDVFQKVPVI